MSCPAGSEVSFLSYRLKSKKQVPVVNGATGSSSFLKNLKLQPFSVEDLEEACRSALGGNWAQPGNHKNTTGTVQGSLQETLTVRGQCTGWSKPIVRKYSADLELSCQDQSWVDPLP